MVDWSEFIRSVENNWVVIIYLFLRLIGSPFRLLNYTFIILMRFFFIYISCYLKSEVESSN